MKLQELVEAIERELGTTAITDRRAKLSLAFTAKKSSDGQFECDFVDASSLSKARAEELHRLELILDRRKTGGTISPRHQLAEHLSPTPAKRSDLEKIRLDTSELDYGDPDTPAYFRRLFPQSD